MRKSTLKLGTMAIAATMMLTPASSVFAADNVENVAVVDETTNQNAEVNEPEIDEVIENLEIAEGTVLEERVGNAQGSVEDIELSNATESEINGNIETYGIFGTKYRVTASELVVRSGPGKSYDSLGSLKKGTTITVKSISSGWAKFKFAGQTAYVYSKYLAKV